MAMESMRQVAALSKTNYGENHFITINGNLEYVRLMFAHGLKEESIEFIRNYKDHLTSVFGQSNQFTIFATNIYIDYMSQTGRSTDVMTLALKKP